MKRFFSLFLAVLVPFFLHSLFWGNLLLPTNAPDISGKIPCLSYDPSFHIPNYNPKKPKMVAEEDIVNDLAFLKQKTDCIRIYTTRNGQDRIPALAENVGLDVIQGVWLDPLTPIESRADYDRAIEVTNAQANITHLVIGNENLFFEDWPRENLIDLLEEAQTRTQTPISYADMPFIWKDNAVLLRYVDVVMAHAFPFWAGENIDGAAFTIIDEILDLQAFAGEVPVMIGETGWPSAGLTQAHARPTGKNQAVFLREFMHLADFYGIWYNLVDAFDQPWKLMSQEGRAGPHFGIWHVPDVPKFNFIGPLFPSRVLLRDGFFIVLCGFLLSLCSFFWHYRQNASKQPLSAFVVFIFGLIAHFGAFSLGAVLHTLFREYLFQSIWPFFLVLLPVLFLFGVLVPFLRESFDVLSDKPLPKLSENEKNIQVLHFPFVSIHVPACNEDPDRLILVLKSLLNLDYPDFEVVLVLNNTKDLSKILPVEVFVESIANKRLKYVREDALDGYKAGALNLALEHTASKAEVIAVVDADYVVSPEWLRKTTPLFADSSVAVVQSPQAHTGNPENQFETAMHDELWSFFRLGMVQRHEKNALIQHGTMTQIRRSALAEVGDWSVWCLCEDAELGLKLLKRGYKVQYVPEVYGAGLLPSDFKGFESQRRRWALGAMQIIKHHARALFFGHKHLSLSQRLEYLFGWTPWIADALYPFFTVLGLGGAIAVLVNSRFFPPAAFFLPLLWAFFTKWGLTFLLFKKRLALPTVRIIFASIMGASVTNAISNGVLAGFFSQNEAFAVTSKGKTKKKTVTSGLASFGLRYDTELSLLLLILSGFILARHGLYHPEALFWTIGAVILSFPSLCVLFLFWFEKNQLHQADLLADSQNLPDKSSTPAYQLWKDTPSLLQNR